MKNQCENGSEFERKTCIFWYVSKLNSSFLKALNVLKPLVLLGRTHFAEKEGNQKRGKSETWSSRKHGKTYRKSYVKPIEKSFKNHWKIDYTMG